MIVREYSDSVNTTDDQLATQQLVTQQPELIVTEPPTGCIDIGGNGLGLWCIVRRHYTNGKRDWLLDRNDYSEAYAFASEAAEAAKAIAAAEGLPVSARVDQAIEQAIRSGRNYFRRGFAEDHCYTKLELQGYREQERRELQQAIDSTQTVTNRNDSLLEEPPECPPWLAEAYDEEQQMNAIIEENDAKPGLDAQMWPPEDYDDSDYGLSDYYADVVPGGIVTAW